MSLEILSDVDFSAWEEPDPAIEHRAFLEGWLSFQRHEFVRKLRGFLRGVQTRKMPLAAAVSSAISAALR